MKSTLVLAGITALARTAVGHATFQQLWVDGKDQQDTCARLPTSNSPVTDVSSNAIRCMLLIHLVGHAVTNPPRR
jgi:cellulase